MISLVSQKNLLLFDQMLEALAKASRVSMDNGSSILPIYSSFRKIQPYLDNLALYCNSQLGAKINMGREAPQELFALSDYCQSEIKKVHEVIQKQNFQEKVNTNFYSEEAIAELGKILQQIDKLPSQSGKIQRYFMRGMLEAARAVMLYRRMRSEADIAHDLNKSEVTENLIEFLSQQGIQLTEEDENSVYDLLYNECAGQLAESKQVSPENLSQNLAHTLHEYFAVDEKEIQPVLVKQSESLCQFIKNAKLKRKKHHAVGRHLGLFEQNIEDIPHENVVPMIYQDSLPLSFFSAQSKSKTDSSLAYLMSFEDNPYFQRVQSQKKQWEAYEEKSVDFDKKSVYSLVGRMSLSWLAHLSKEWNYIDSSLDEIADQISDIEDNDDEIDRTISAGFQNKDLKNEVLAYTRDLINATYFSEKYLQIKLNNTGVTVDTLDKLLKKESLDMQDVNLLSEIVGNIGQNLDDADNVIGFADFSDCDDIFSLVSEMPHGKEKQEALECLKGSFDAIFSDVYENLEASLFDIDCVVGNVSPEAKNQLLDFIEISKGNYSDIQNESTEELARKLHMGVLVGYVIPAYQGKSLDGDEKNAAISFIDNYDDLHPKTQEYLVGLTNYYAQKVMEKHSDYIEKGISSDLEEALDDYNDCHVSLGIINGYQESVDKLLQEEKAISLEYQKYQKQKSMFELPKNFDLMLASIFANSGR